MHELCYRVSGFDPNVRNPAAGNLLGGTSYEGWGPGRCNCGFAQTYPYAVGPRIGAAYRIDNKTVLRAGGGITYSRTADFSWMGPSIGVGYNTINFSSTSYGDPALVLKTGMQYNIADLYQANFDPGLRPRTGQIDSPGALTDRNGGRPPRVFQWSIGLQREIMKDLVVEANYVGNRGAWLEANSLIDLNAISNERLRARGRIKLTTVAGAARAWTGRPALIAIGKLHFRTAKNSTRASSINKEVPMNRRSNRSRRDMPTRYPRRSSARPALILLPAKR